MEEVIATQARLQELRAAIDAFEQTPGWWNAEAWEQVKGVALEAEEKDRLWKDALVRLGEMFDRAHKAEAEAERLQKQVTYEVGVGDTLRRMARHDSQLIEKLEAEAERLRAERDELSALLEAMTGPAKSLAQINHEIMMAVHGPGGINEQSALAGTEAER